MCQSVLINKRIVDLKIEAAEVFESEDIDPLDLRLQTVKYLYYQTFSKLGCIVHSEFTFDEIDLVIEKLEDIIRIAKDIYKGERLIKVLTNLKDAFIFKLSIGANIKA